MKKISYAIFSLLLFAIVTDINLSRTFFKANDESIYSARNILEASCISLAMFTAVGIAMYYYYKRNKK